MRRTLLRVCCIGALLVSACDSPVDSPPEPPRVVLLIGDGMGTGILEAARHRAGGLAMDALPVRGSISTASASDSITDSAAAATAFATGILTYNGGIGVGPDSLPRRTVLELAHERGMATGLVATSSVTHATPAAFAAHVVDRDLHDEIAAEITQSGVDALLGGGRQFFQPEHLAGFSARGCEVRTAPGPLNTGAAAQCLVGVFAADGMPPVTSERSPTLAGMAVAAIDVLRRDPDGFFLMVEGSQIDWAGHANASEWMIQEALDFDETVAAVRRELSDLSNVLIIVTADHETGGVTFDAGQGGDVVRFSTKRHTAADVPLFASGPRAEDLRMVETSDALGRFLLRRVEGH